MKSTISFCPLRFLAVAAVLLGPFTAASRGASPQAPPATPNTNLVSPEVSADRHVTFRLYAPGAHEVVMQCEYNAPPSTNIPLTKAENGV
jgi:hypothetical protein